MGYRVKPFTMRVRNNSTQEFEEVGIFGYDVESDINELKTKTNWLTTPEEHGAVGDGSTDDTDAFVLACAAGHVVCDPTKTYKVSSIVLTSDAMVENGNFVIDSFETGPNFDYRWVFEGGKGHAIDLINCSFTSTADRLPRINALNNFNDGVCSNVVVAHSIGNCDHIRLKDCKLKNVSAIFVAGNNILEARLENCVLEHCELGVYCHCDHTKVYCIDSTIDITLDDLNIWYHAFYIAHASNVLIANSTLTNSAETSDGAVEHQTGVPLNFSDPTGPLQTPYDAIVTGCKVTSTNLTTAFGASAGNVAMSNCVITCMRLAHCTGNTKNSVFGTVINRVPSANLYLLTDQSTLVYELVDNGTFVRFNTNAPDIRTGSISGTFTGSLITDGLNKRISIEGKPSSAISAGADIPLGYFSPLFRPTSNITTYLQIQDGVYAVLTLVASSGKATLTPKQNLNTGTNYYISFTYI